MKSLLIDRENWDICLDASGNIAVCSEPYSLAQDAACAISLFVGEAYYANTKGIPWFGKILGQLPPFAVIKGFCINAAMSVPDVVSAEIFFSNFDNKTRTMFGQVSVTSADNQTGTVAIGLGS